MLFWVSTQHWLQYSRCIRLCYTERRRDTRRRRVKTRIESHGQKSNRKSRCARNDPSKFTTMCLIFLPNLRLNDFALFGFATNFTLCRYEMKPHTTVPFCFPFTLTRFYNQYKKKITRNVQKCWCVGYYLIVKNNTRTVFVKAIGLNRQSYFYSMVLEIFLCYSWK